MVPGTNTGANPVGRNALVTSVMVCCGFIVCWTPNEIVFFLNYVGYHMGFSGWFYHFTVFRYSCEVVIPSSKYVSNTKLLRQDFLFWYCWFYHFTVVLVNTNSCINPLIYAAKYREFQHGVRRLMAKLKLNNQQAQVSAIT